MPPTAIPVVFRGLLNSWMSLGVLIFVSHDSAEVLGRSRIMLQRLSQFSLVRDGYKPGEMPFTLMNGASFESFSKRGTEIPGALLTPIRILNVCSSFIPGRAERLLRREKRLSNRTMKRVLKAVNSRIADDSMSQGACPSSS